jgi:16S rRNA (cytidine1402-2'-O)-methyltransferase
MVQYPLPSRTPDDIMAGTLFVVATPIGNLEDITMRALRVLREADVIAAEDTRRTAKLLSHYGIATPTSSFHVHNRRTRLPQLLDRLDQGQRVALVTDAGTPGVSDPGVELVAACRERGIAVETIPGPSAALVAAVGSGFPLNSVTFLGFPPLKAKPRNQWLLQLAAVPHTIVFFESPHRIAATLADLATSLGKRQICVAREMTKAHEEFVLGPASSDLFRLITRKGEFTVVVGPRDDVAAEAKAPVDDDAIVSAFRALDKDLVGSGKRHAVGLVARELGIPANDVYRAIERSKI